MSLGLEAALLRDQVKALVVIAQNGRDPDLAPFIGGARLGRSIVLADLAGRRHLAFLSPLDRGEAAATGLALLDPERLGLAKAAREAKDSADLLARALGQALQHAGIAPGRVALAGHEGSGTVLAACRALEAEGWEFASGEELVRGLRKRKQPEEVEEIARVAAGTCAAFRRLAEILASASTQGGELWHDGDRLTVERLRGEVALVLASHGLEQPEGNILAPGEEGGVPHNSGTPSRVLRPGESLVVDLFPRGRLFADCTRTFCVGPPPAALERAHRSVEQALRLAHARARVGVRGEELNDTISELFEQQGFATLRSAPGTEVGYVHSLGHGVGYELHELPQFRRPGAGQPEEFGRFEEGDVLTLEPGLYDAGAGWAVRLEDLCHLGPQGVENLTPLPYELDPQAWISGRAPGS